MRKSYPSDISRKQFEEIRQHSHEGYGRDFFVSIFYYHTWREQIGRGQCQHNDTITTSFTIFITCFPFQLPYFLIVGNIAGYNPSFVLQ